MEKFDEIISQRSEFANSNSLERVFLLATGYNELPKEMVTKLEKDYLVGKYFGFLKTLTLPKFRVLKYLVLAGLACYTFLLAIPRYRRNLKDRFHRAVGGVKDKLQEIRDRRAIQYKKIDSLATMKRSS